MKLSNCRVVRSSTQPAENPQILPQMHSRSNPPSRTTRRNHRENEQTHRVPGQIQRRRRAHRHPHRRNRPTAPLSSKPQRNPCQRIDHAGTDARMSCCAICAVDREYAASAYGGYTHPTGTATAAEHTGTYTAGTGPSCLCPANCKNGHTSVTDHVGAAAAYHSDRAIGGKYAATAHGRCAHLVRTEAAAERTSAHTTGAGTTRVCSASCKGCYNSTATRTGAGTTSHNDHTNGRKCATPARG